MYLKNAIITSAFLFISSLCIAEIFEQNIDSTTISSKKIQSGFELTKSTIPFFTPQSHFIKEMSLKEVMEKAIFYNPNVEKARLEWLASCQTSQASWGIYEPKLAGSYKRNDLKRENTTLESLQQAGNTQFSEKSDEYNLSIDGKSLSGANYNLGYSQTDSKNNLTIFDESKAFAGVTVSQPLLKGAWFGAPWADVKINKTDRLIAFHDYRAKVMKTVYETESAYWNLAFMEEKHRIAIESVEIAKKLVRDGKERFRIGLMSQLDLDEAEAGLAIRLSNKADQMQELIEAVNRIKLLLSNNHISEDTWIQTITPLFIAAEQADEINKSNNVTPYEALKIQPDYLVRQYQLNRERISLNYEKNKKLPELNFNGSLGYNGFGRKASEAWRKITEKKQPTWSLGAKIEIPLFMGIQERNTLEASKLKKQMAEENLKAAEYEIISSVRSLRQRMEALRERITNAEKVINYRKRLLDAEFLRLQAGKSNVRIIYDAEEKLNEAKQSHLESILKYRETAMQFALVSGTLLHERGLEVMEDGKPMLSERLLRPEQ